MLEKLKDIIFHREPYLITYNLTVSDGRKIICQELVKADSEATANSIINHNLKLLNYEIISIANISIKES